MADAENAVFKTVCGRPQTSIQVRFRPRASALADEDGQGQPSWSSEPAASLVVSRGLRGGKGRRRFSRPAERCAGDPLKYVVGGIEGRIGADNYLLRKLCMHTSM